MNCIIIEDQPPAQRILKKYISDYDSLRLIGTFSDAIQASEFLKREQVDIVFLDIHLPKMSGIDFLKSIAHTPNIILTTAFPDYALESYEFNVVDYLLKPFSFQRFVKAILKVPPKHHAEALVPQNQSPIFPTEIFIKSGYEHIKLKVSDIVFIKSDADYTEIYTNLKKYLSSESLRHWLGLLDATQFFRVHKSYIINTSKIEKIAGNQIYLDKNIIVPLGRAFKESFTARFLK